MNKIKYEIYKKGEEKRVKFLYPESIRNKDYCVSKDKNGYEYFHIPNIYSDNILHLFIGRIKDAVNSIQENNGDVIMMHNLFGFHNENVIKYIDRKYGEKMRQQCIKGFKDTEFGYSLKFGYLNSFNGSSFVTEDQSLQGYKENDYIYFNDLKSAEQFKRNILNKAKCVCNNYKLMEINKYTENKMEKYLRKTLEKSLLIFELFCAINESIKNKKINYKFEIVQVIKKSSL